ncbi:outer membrane lipoprotein carrier protein LolA [Marinicauda salina]|uniref:Outer membrane lipoprotein carrier protein LolA n=1 Tax=Marinicauda salina TaxID=2135793 RepID=A0A2U2BWK0_9PROT|nr:outer-membrane lipoprotein carrier protein LolA [Marinicauda salina]PWE18377.1 outer membrane lipoprotein carrier protein LolA [Marinicauda salina]
MTNLALLLSTLASLAQAGEALPAGDAPAETPPAESAESAPAETDAGAAAEEPDAEPLTDGAAAALDDPAPETLEADDGTDRADSEEIARVQAWLDGLDTLSGRFTQVAADGETTQGTVHLDRPGRARFDYDDPTPVLLVADGTTVAVADLALETIDRAPIRATPMRWLLAEDLDLAASGAVVEAERYDDELFVSLEDPEGETEGRLTLVFADPDPDAPAGTMTLRGWYAVDAMGGLTQITLDEVERGGDLDPRLFILDDEDVMGDDRRRGRRR